MNADEADDQPTEKPKRTKSSKQESAGNVKLFSKRKDDKQRRLKRGQCPGALIEVGPSR